MAVSAYRLKWSDYRAPKIRKECNKSGRARFWHYQIAYTLDGVEQTPVIGLTPGIGERSGRSRPLRAVEGWMAGEMTQADMHSTDWDWLLDELYIEISNNDDTTLKLRYYSEDNDGTNDCAKATTIIIDKSPEVAAAEEAARDEAMSATMASAGLALSEPGMTVSAEHTMDAAIAAYNANQPHITLSIASMSKSMTVDRETGLIGADSFRLRWNNLETVSEWDRGVKLQYIAIKKGEVPASMAIIKEKIYLPPAKDYKIFNTYSDLNTGKQQKPPTLTSTTERDVGGGRTAAVTTPTFNVSYGARGGQSGEQSVFKNKYKRFEGVYEQGMTLAIDTIVNAALQEAKTPSKYNFKKVDTNTRFKRRKLSLFGNKATMRETIDVTTATAATIMSTY